MSLQALDDDMFSAAMGSVFTLVLLFFSWAFFADCVNCRVTLKRTRLSRKVRVLRWEVRWRRYVHFLHVFSFSHAC